MRSTRAAAAKEAAQPESTSAASSSRPNPGTDASQAGQRVQQAGDVEDTINSPQASTSSTRKREQVRHACLHCRNDKVKCSGTHPVCSRCHNRQTECSYEVPMEGVTKSQHLRQQFAEQTDRLERVNSMMELFRHGTDKEATEALARLRIGQSLEHVLEHFSRRQTTSNPEEDFTDPSLSTMPFEPFDYYPAED